MSQFTDQESTTYSLNHYVSDALEGGHWSFPKYSRTFNEFGESGKSLKHELG